MKWLLCELILSCSLAAEPLSLQELTYRNVLFDYYQEQYDAALVSTLVAQERSYAPADDPRFELAKGSFAFKDGMYAFAKESFESVDPSELTDLDRMRLSFHLARVHHRRQDWQPLAEELAVVGNLESQFEVPLAHPEVGYMRAELAIATGDGAGAEAALASLEEQDPLRAYGLYNLGVYHRDNNDLAAAESAFTQLAEGEWTAAESFDLAQRARLALAVIARQNEDQQTAESLLTALPGEGRYKETALAAYGNLAMQGEDPELAARIWLTLQQEERWTAGATAARLGFPISLESIAKPQTVLLHYQNAEQGFERRLADLNNLVASTYEPTWVTNLSRAFGLAQREPDALAEFLRTLAEQIGHDEWVQWLSGEETYALMEQWQQLENMRGFLDGLPEVLDGLSAVADEQQRRAGLARNLLEDQGLLASRDELATLVAGMASKVDDASQLAQLDDRAWLSSLADEEELKTLNELWELRDNFAQVEHADQAEWLARVDRLLGVQYFQIANSLATRRWQLIRKVQELEAELHDMDERIARVKGAEAHFVAGAGSQFTDYLTRSQTLISQVDAAQQLREERLAGVIRERIGDEAERVERYLFVTRVAIARATDQLAIATLEEGEQ